MHQGPGSQNCFRFSYLTFKSSGIVYDGSICYNKSSEQSLFCSALPPHCCLRNFPFIEKKKDIRIPRFYDLHGPNWWIFFCLSESSEKSSKYRFYVMFTSVLNIAYTYLLTYRILQPVWIFRIFTYPDAYIDLHFYPWIYTFISYSSPFVEAMLC